MQEEPLGGVAAKKETEKLEKFLQELLGDVAAKREAEKFFKQEPLGGVAATRKAEKLQELLGDVVTTKEAAGLLSSVSEKWFFACTNRNM